MMPEPELAVVVLDWKRPQNMPHVIQSIREQSIPVDLYIVHQANNRVYDSAENIHVQTNRGCGTRWDILPLVENKYTVFIDDDIKLTDPKILETMLIHVRSKDHVSAVGIILGEHPERPYSSGNKVYAPEKLTEVNICMGNINMIRTRYARIMWCSSTEYIRTMRRPGTDIIGDDDIISSYLFNQSRFKNYSVGNGEKPYETLSTLHGLENMPDHYEFRNELCRKLTFTPLEVEV
jgi:hypothetical protein